jgi:hypothetical protein
MTIMYNRSNKGDKRMVKITVNGKWIGYIVSTGLTTSEVNAKVNRMVNRNFPPGTVTTSKWEFV